MPSKNQKQQKRMNDMTTSKRLLPIAAALLLATSAIQGQAPQPQTQATPPPAPADTIVMTAGVLILQIGTGTLAAYGFACGKFKGRDAMFYVVLGALMIPLQVTFIPIFIMCSGWGLNDTFLGLILPSVTSVFYIYLLKENFAQIPDELYYAAKVDGTTDLRYLRRVMIPICKPTLITIIILKIIECWNSYVWPRLITDNPDYYLVSNGIQEIRENGFGRENIPAMMAAVVVISVPLIVLFLVFRRKVMAGVARGGTKG